MFDLNIKLLPRSSKNEVVGWQADGRLKIKITAPPVDGRANTALVELLAKHFRVPKSTVEIIRGATIPEKIVRLHAVDKLAPQ